MRADLSALLKSLPLAVSIESAYLAMRILRYRFLLEQMSRDSIIAKGGAMSRTKAVVLHYHYIERY